MVPRVELDAAFSAAKRNSKQRALPRHLARKRLELVEADLLVVPHAALVGAQQVVVLNPVSLEDAGFTVVHLHREMYDQLVLGLRKDRLRMSRKAGQLGCLLEIALNDLEEAELL